ncbi:Glutathione S-transferase [Musa troglodytarum]|uniref:Glutathione S-transferase n=1 Tax=Musa troglodytarum TaxID=320322 RepID=A0A9E7FYE7_9LILI|nr:Glutathione S-transferase [Musa troglodytarum]
MMLRVYADRMSQPSRAIVIFCKVNGIDFEEVRIDIVKRQHLSPEFKEINPMGQVPAIVDGRFKLFESHAILSYLSCAFPGVPDHCFLRLSSFVENNGYTLSGLLDTLEADKFYLVTHVLYGRYPADLFTRAKIQSILDWHHSNLRRGASTFVLNRALGPGLGLPLNPQAANEAEKILRASLSKIESLWLKGNAKFLSGNFQPSIADLSLVCEIMQLEVVDEKDRDRILGPHPRILQWIENVKSATSPHFEEVHGFLYKVKARLHSRLANTKRNDTQLSMKPNPKL